MGQPGDMPDSARLLCFWEKLRIIYAKKAGEHMATLKDISAVTGISVSTISRVLNRDETISVSAQTQARIFSVAQELGYVPTRRRVRPEGSRHAATSLKMGIAQMFEPERVLQDPYYLYMKNELEKECFEQGIETTTLFRNEEGLFQAPGGGALDGIFAIGSFTREEIDSFERYTPHVVFVDSTPDDEHYYAVVPNFHLGLRQAMSRFLETGHRRIAFLGSHYTLQGTHDWLLDARLYYFRNILQAKGIYDEALVWDCGMTSPEAYQVLSGALRANKARPDALFLSSDAMVQGALRALEEAGLKIPQDISIIAFNDTSLSQNAVPPLSSIRVLQHELAFSALHAMHLCRENHPNPCKTVVPTLYMERGSVIARNTAPAV